MRKINREKGHCATDKVICNAGHAAKLHKNAYLLLLFYLHIFASDQIMEESNNFCLNQLFSNFRHKKAIFDFF